MLIKQLVSHFCLNNMVDLCILERSFRGMLFPQLASGKSLCSLKLWNYEIIKNVLNECLVFPSSYLNGNRPKSFWKKVLIFRSKKVLRKKVLLLKSLRNKKFYQFEISLSIVKNLIFFCIKITKVKNLR